MNQELENRIFHTENVTKVYHTGSIDVHALRGVNAEVFKGEFTVLLGASGSGKSTFLNILGGLDSATDGRAWFRDQELTSMSERGLTRYRRDHVGFVFQFYNLVPSLTARENVALVTEISRDPMSPEEALERVNEDLGTTTVVITHNAGIREMAHRVIYFADGNISDTVVNKHRVEPADIEW